MSSMFTSLLPFLAALRRQNMPSPQDEDGSNPTADQFDNAGSPAPSQENAATAAASQSNPVGNTVPGTAQPRARTPAPQQAQDTKGDLLMRLLRSGLQGSNPNALPALAPLTQGNPAPPLGVMPDGSLVQDMGYLQHAPSRIPQAGPDPKSGDMSLSPDGLAALKEHERLGLQIYQDQAGYDTIGYGHKILAGEDYSKGLKDEAEASALLEQDVQKAVRAVNAGLKVAVTPNQFDALVSLAFNAGAGAVGPENEMMQAVNAGKVTEANFTAYKYIHKNGKPMISPGLLKRRKEEYQQFNTETTPPLSVPGVQAKFPAALLQSNPSPPLPPLNLPGVQPKLPDLFPQGIPAQPPILKP